MSSALRIGAKRVAAAAARPAQVTPRRSLHEGQARLLEKRKIFQANPHLHGADNPTYLKNGTADTATFAFGGLLVFAGLAKVTTGLYHMSFGTHVLEIE